MLCQDTLKQFKTIRTYYDFPDVDVDPATALRSDAAGHASGALNGRRETSRVIAQLD